jgi:hypothetical protein
MARDVKRVSIKRDTDIAAMAEQVSVDKEPRVLEKDGEALAAVVSMDDLERLLLTSPTREDIERSLRAIGSWGDFDADEFIERLYRYRHESPPSPPVEW